MVNGKNELVEKLREYRQNLDKLSDEQKEEEQFKIQLLFLRENWPDCPIEKRIGCFKCIYYMIKNDRAFCNRSGDAVPYNILRGKICNHYYAQISNPLMVISPAVMVIKESFGCDCSNPASLYDCKCRSEAWSFYLFLIRWVSRASIKEIAQVTGICNNNLVLRKIKEAEQKLFNDPKEQQTITRLLYEMEKKLRELSSESYL